MSPISLLFLRFWKGSVGLEAEILEFRKGLGGLEAEIFAFRKGVEMILEGLKLKSLIFVRF